MTENYRNRLIEQRLKKMVVSIKYTDGKNTFKAPFTLLDEYINGALPSNDDLANVTAWSIVDEKFVDIPCENIKNLFTEKILKLLIYQLLINLI